MLKGVLVAPHARAGWMATAGSLRPGIPWLLLGLFGLFVGSFLGLAPLKSVPGGLNPRNSAAHTLIFLEPPYTHDF